MALRILEMTIKYFLLVIKKFLIFYSPNWHGHRDQCVFGNSLRSGILLDLDVPKAQIETKIQSKL